MFDQYIDTYLAETESIIRSIDRRRMARLIEILGQTRENGGRLFILGIGGSAGNASHATNDFRKIAAIEAYAPTDNVCELTAWTNDDSFEVIFVNWLKTSKLSPRDALMIFSVGGGSETTSRNLVLAMQYAKQVGAKVLAVVSRDGGAASSLADVCLLIPVVSQERITPHAEGWQGIVWHLAVNALVWKDRHEQR